MVNNNYTGSVKFVINLKGGEDILKRNDKLQALEQNAIQKIKSQVEAGFLQQFGFAGKFEVSAFMTDRISFQVHGADSKTKATLAKNPKWLEQYSNSITIG